MTGVIMSLLFKLMEVKTISVSRKLGIETRRPQVLVCYDLMEGLINEEEDLIFETEPEIDFNWHNYSIRRSSFVVECWSVINHKH
jgi:hypothetical protein